MHCVLIVEEDPLWVQASGVVLYVAINLVKSCAWRGLGVFIFIVRLRVVFCISVDIVRFVINVNT